VLRLTQKDIKSLRSLLKNSSLVFSSSYREVYMPPAYSDSTFKSAFVSVPVFEVHTSVIFPADSSPLISLTNKFYFFRKLVAKMVAIEIVRGSPSGIPATIIAATNIKIFMKLIQLSIDKKVS
jgi:hypothetical protein